MPPPSLFMCGGGSGTGALGVMLPPLQPGEQLADGTTWHGHGALNPQPHHVPHRTSRRECSYTASVRAACAAATSVISLPPSLLRLQHHYAQQLSLHGQQPSAASGGLALGGAVGRPLPALAGSSTAHRTSYFYYYYQQQLQQQHWADSMLAARQVRGITLARQGREHMSEVH
jgi:hypothetical protein